MNSLHVDLPHTTMEDFAEHFERAVQRNARFLAVVSDDDPREPFVSLRHRMANPTPEQFMAMIKEEAPVNPDPSTYVMIMVDRAEFGQVEIRYMVAVQQAEGETPIFAVAVNAIRYRHDKLRIVVTEYRNPPIRIPAIRRWLSLLWGEGEDGIVEQKLDGSGKEYFENEMQRIFEPRLEADKWLISEYFEVHQEKLPPRKFVDEYMRIRQEVDGVAWSLADAKDRVRQTIHQERVRRKKAKT